MLRIPYVPTAYPDEIFGSLLTRLVLYNGKGLWRSLLEEAGYGRRTISPFFAIPVKTARLDNLLSLFGYTYESMLRQLTVLPFWLTFNNASRSRVRITVPTVGDSGTKLFLVGKKSINSGARFCPACLADDVETFGEPYLHRHHQLPVALVCAKHGEWLQASCKACGVITLPFNKMLLRPPPLRCECGQDLTKKSGPPSFQQSSFQRLSKFAQSTLTCTNAPWSHTQIRTLLQFKMNSGKKDFQQKALKLLESTYGPTTRNSSGLKFLLKPIDTEDTQLELSAPIHLLRAPEFCTLFSATGLTFEEFSSAASALPDTSPNPVSDRSIVRHFTIEQARHEFNRLSQESPLQVATRLHNGFTRLYWLLRLQDGPWLEQRISGPLRTIASVESDRAKILQALKEKPWLKPNRMRSGVWVRALIRDAIWLQSHLNEFSTHQVVEESKAKRVQRERAIALSRALFTVLKSERKPARIHAGLLSKFAKISMHQAQHTIANFPQLRHLIDAINAGKDRRMAMWAARALINAGQRPTSTDVLLLAGLNTTRVNRQFAIEALARSDQDR